VTILKQAFPLLFKLATLGSNVNDTLLIQWVTGRQQFPPFKVFDRKWERYIEHDGTFYNRYAF
jgi:hypothetical protein